MEKKAKEIFTRVMTGLSALIFVFGFVIFISVMSASAGKIPSVLGYSFLQVRTGSMEPEYPIGTVIVTKKANVFELKVGDVISFYSTEKDIQGQVNTHRIVEIEKTMTGYPVFTTKGDANDFEDPDKVSSVKVIGKVIYNIGTVSGSVISVLSNPKVIFFFIVLPLIFITFGEAVNLVTLILKSKEEQEEEQDGESEKEKN